MKKRICWITGDYFIDVDMTLVPYLQEHFEEWQIDWYVIKGVNSDIQIPENSPTKQFQLKYRGKDPRIILEYYKIFKNIQINKSDVIYSNYVGVPFYYRVLLRMNRNIPVIHAAHNVIPYPVWPKSLVHYTNYVFEHNKYFHLFSNFTQEYVKQHYPNKSIFYCPMTLKGYGEVSTNNYKIEKSKLNLLFFGNVIANKRLDLLIDIIKELPKEVKSKVHLTIAGKCKNPQLFINQINNDSCISFFFKHIDDCEVAELFSKHDFLMLPYQDVAQSGPHMIAYYYNLPVIASDIDGFKERVEDGVNGFLFKLNDKQSLSQSIIKAINMNAEERAKMKETLYDYTQSNYNIANIAKRYIGYFNSLQK